MTTIKEMAARIPTTTAKKLLSEFARKFPEKSWTIDSDVPTGFDEAFDQHANEYAEASGVSLPKGQITQLPEALKDNKLILESIEYGVVEAVAQLRSQSLIQSAKLQALQDIQATESAYNSVWEQYFENRIDANKAKTETQGKEALNNSKQLNDDLGKRQGKLIQTQTLLTASQRQTSTDIEKAITAIFN